MTQEGKTILKEPSTISNGTKSKKISRSKDYFDLKTAKHNVEKGIAKRDTTEKEWFIYKRKVLR